MPETILITFLLAKKKGYHIKPLFKERAFYGVLFFECIYLVMQIMFFNRNFALIPYTGTIKTLYIASFLLLIYRFELPIQALIGSGLVVLGGICNDIAMAVNGGIMPVFPTLSYITGYVDANAITMAQDFHRLGNSETQLKWLTDIFDVGYAVLSIGDVFIRCFVGIVIYYSIKKLNIEKSLI